MSSTRAQSTKCEMKWNTCAATNSPEDFLLSEPQNTMINHGGWASFVEIWWSLKVMWGTSPLCIDVMGVASRALHRFVGSLHTVLGSL